MDLLQTARWGLYSVVSNLISCLGNILTWIMDLFVTILSSPQSSFWRWTVQRTWHCKIYHHQVQKRCLSHWSQPVFWSLWWLAKNRPGEMVTYSLSYDSTQSLKLTILFSGTLFFWAKKITGLRFMATAHTLPLNTSLRQMWDTTLLEETTNNNGRL